MAVDPDLLVMMPGPVPRHPRIVHSMAPVTPAMHIVRPVANFHI